MSQSNNAERNGGPEPPGGRKAEPPRRLRGFAAMDPEKRRRVSSVGGRAAHQKGTGHEFTSDEARIAGRKGGAASRERRGKMNSGAGSENHPTAEQQQSGDQTGASAEGQSMGEAAESMESESSREEIETQE